MMLAKTVTVAVLLFLMAVGPVYQNSLSEKRENLLNVSGIGYIVPSRLAGPASLDFKGIVSDLLYLKVSTFIGGKFIEKEKITPEYADVFYQAADVITDLDPWFWDAYLMNSIILAWDFNRTELANNLLKKASKNRTWDFNPPYYLGFNYFYFLKDNAAASSYLMEAVKRGGAPSYIAALASRLGIYQNQFGPVILFLEEQLKTTQNPAMAKRLEIRLRAVLILDRLERKVREFKTAYGYLPASLSDLIVGGMITHIPPDPYGGEFYVMENGRVFSTSNLRPVKSKTQHPGGDDK